ncbi:arginine--tRNA ligase [Candidatus Saccharibacteria bacterium]|nr:arginine--tRNA ligase [Candidatus Saccharibacteria bacterium]
MASSSGVEKTQKTAPEVEDNIDTDPTPWGYKDTPTDLQLGLTEGNRQLDQTVKALLADKAERLQGVDLPPSEAYPIANLQASLNEKILEHFNSSIGLVVERPSIKGKKVAADSDLSLNIMPLVRDLGEGYSVPEIASIIANFLSQDARVRATTSVGPYINIELDDCAIGTEVFTTVAELGDHYGWFRNGTAEIVVIDYSSPNIAKNLTLAHLRSTIIGQALVNLQEASGNVPFGVNHIGDWGTHFGNIMYQYEQEFATRGEVFLEELSNDPATVLMQIYRKFNDELKELPEDERTSRQNAGRQRFLELEQGNPDYVALWEKFREWSLADFRPIYERLGVEFDAIQGESFYEDRMVAAINEAIDKGVLRQNADGSVVFPSQDLVDPSTMSINSQIMRSKDGSPRDEIVIKPSGGTVYLTRDIAAIMYRCRELKADRILYVIGKEQGPHCIELFNIAHQMGELALGQALHVSFGHLNIGGKKMSSRGGKVTLLGEVLDDAQQAAHDSIRERIASHPGLPDNLTEEMGVSSVIFGDLRQDRIKDIEFDPETDVPEMLKNGGASYIQYTFARLNSLLEKAGLIVEIDTLDDGSDYMNSAVHKIEKEVLMAIARLPQSIRDASEANAPHKLANYLTELCQLVNSFQSSPELRVLKAETPSAQMFRVQLVAAASQTIENAAKILQLQLPAKM